VNIANNQGKESFWAVLKNYENLSQKPMAEAAKLETSITKARASVKKDTSNLWPGLPDGVALDIEGSKIHLTWSKSRYPDLKELIDQLAASAPRALQKLRNPKSHKVSKSDTRPGTID
jgi:hypothetical protein